MQLLTNHETILIILKICLTLLTAVIVNFILRIFIHVPKQLGSRRSQTYATVIRNTISVVVYVIAAHYVLIFLGINITPLLASAGVAGLALGLGAKSLIEDLIAGFFLLGQATIAIGDYIIVNDTEGFIETIGFRTLSIRDEAGALHIIPNGLIKQVTNYSRGRINVYIDIPIKSDQPVETVMKIINESLDKLQKEKDRDLTIYPESKVLGIDDLKAGNIMVMRINLVTTATQRWNASKRLRLLIKKGFEKNKILFG